MMMTVIDVCLAGNLFVLFLSVWPLFLFDLGAFLFILFRSFLCFIAFLPIVAFASAESWGWGALHFGIYICICIRYTSDANLSFSCSFTT